MSKYTAEQVCEAVRGFAGYSHVHHGVGAELLDIATDYAALLRERESPQPIPMILYCPSCHTQHIDRAEVDVGQPDSPWMNPPHRSHLCYNCGTIWRPADVPTTGVEKILTEGKSDVDMPAPMLASVRVPEREALEAIKRLPARHFPDPIAHSWEAFGRAVMGAFTDAKFIAIRALAAAPKPKTEE